jgi:hypothetical protein
MDNVTTMQESLPARSVQAVFEEAYRDQHWGTSQSGFHSGIGSDTEFAVPYAALIQEIVASFASLAEISTPAPVRFVDLGCGDFRVASLFVSDAIDYVGLDVVPGLVEYNQRTFGSARVKFRHLDIIQERWPDGEICAIRQVLQHLSNKQISLVIAQLHRYPVVVITEHQPCDSRKLIPNRNMPHSSNIRLYRKSGGVFLDEPPFNVDHLELRLALDAGDESEIRTFVLDRR